MCQAKIVTVPETAIFAQANEIALAIWCAAVVVPHAFRQARAGGGVTRPIIERRARTWARSKQHPYYR